MQQIPGKMNTNNDAMLPSILIAVLKFGIRMATTMVLKNQTVTIVVRRKSSLEELCSSLKSLIKKSSTATLPQNNIKG